MAERPEVSVLIPTRNRWSLVSRTALPAALGQEDVDFEIVVVDDGSTDDTWTRLQELERVEPTVRVLRHAHPQGVSAARNSGIEAARGEWVAFLDDDDVWSPRKLRAQLDAADSHGAKFAFAGAVAVDERGRVLYTYYMPKPSDLSDQLLRSAVVPAGASNVLASTSVVRELGGFDEALFHLEDWDLWLRLAALGEPAVVDEILVGVLFHSRNKHAVHDQSDELMRLLEKHASLEPPRRLTVDRLGHSRWVASQHSRAGMHGRAAWLYLRGAYEHRSAGNILRSIDALIGKRLSTLLGKSTSATTQIADAPVAPQWLGHYAWLGGAR